ncbi:MAG: TRAP transporter solute receptor, TAXI family precursor [Firmicutes bacterium]|nr:TRAP transporter solute receptor, TAXI family precursor [Bacillota bacterium]
MKKNYVLKTVFLILLISSLGFMSIGCSSKSASKGGVISIATGGTAGTYYPIGGVMAELINSKMDGWSATAEVTGASIENVRLIENKEAELALANANAPYYAVKGEPPFEKPYTNVRAIVAHHPSTMQLVTLEETGIKSVEDLKGKRVNVGAPGGATDVMAWHIMEAYGFKRGDIIATTLNLSEVVEAFKDGSIDAAFMLSGYPMSALIDLYASRNVVMLSIDEAILKKLSDEHPYYTPGIIEAGTYNGLTYDVKSNTVWNLLICHKDLPDDFVYEMLELFYNNLDLFKAAHPMCRFMTLENATLGVPIDYHPGAEKWLKEKGLLK